MTKHVTFLGSGGNRDPAEAEDEHNIGWKPELLYSTYGKFGHRKDSMIDTWV
jgi:hypothetical protein